MMTKRELFNAKNAGKKIEAGLEFTVASVGQFDDTDKDGNAVKVTALGTVDGDVYTTISATVASSIDLLNDIVIEEGIVKVRVNECVSNGGRKFYQLQIL